MRLIRILFLLVLIVPAACKEKQKQAEDAKASPPSAATEAPLPTAVVSAPPTLAPMLRKVGPGVVNIAVRGTVQTALNPLFQDPLFRRFFGIPDIPAEQQFQAVGSGVIYDAAKGYIITNSHVVEHADSIMVKLSDRRQVKATLVGADKETDVAVLKIEADDLTALTLGDSSKLQVGDYVVAIGNPFGVGQTATFGIVSAVGRSGLGIESYEDFIQTDASINPGNSGGALFDLNGALVGMNTAILSQSGGNVGIGFAIPINMVKNVVEQLIAHGKVARGQLGVIIQDLTPQIAEAMGVKATGGAIVSQVLPDSAAAKAGLESGDIVTALDGKPLRDASELRNSIGLKPPGTTVELTVLRKGQERTIKVLTQEPTPEKAVNAPSGSPIDGVKLGAIPQDDPLYGQVKGVYVQEVADGSPAQAAGLEAGDIIMAANQKPVTAPKELLDIVAAGKGKVLLLNIRRGDTAIFLTIQ
jgi:serine protease Do/serine protease DegQ